MIKVINFNIFPREFRVKNKNFKNNQIHTTYLINMSYSTQAFKFENKNINSINYEEKTTHLSLCKIYC